MPHNREKDYTLSGLRKEPIRIDDYREAPWCQSYTNIKFDFRRWLYVGRPELAQQNDRITPLNNVEGKPLVHAGRDGMVEAIRNAVWSIPSVEPITKNHYCRSGISNWFEFLDYCDAVGQPIHELAEINTEVLHSFIHWLRFTKEANTETGRLSVKGQRNFPPPGPELFSTLGFSRG